MSSEFISLFSNFGGVDDAIKNSTWRYMSVCSFLQIPKLLNKVMFVLVLWPQFSFFYLPIFDWVDYIYDVLMPWWRCATRRGPYFSYLCHLIQLRTDHSPRILKFCNIYFSVASCITWLHDTHLYYVTRRYMRST